MSRGVVALSGSTLNRAWARVREKALQWADFDGFPTCTRGGKWQTIAAQVRQAGFLPHEGAWMVGDLPAILWFVWDAEDPRSSFRERLRAEAARWSGRLAVRAEDGSMAALAHVFFRGAMIGYCLGNERSLRDLAVAAAQTVVRRFRDGGYLQSFGPPGAPEWLFTTVDDLINLPLLFWVGRETGAGALDAYARREADLIRRHLVRPDGSTAQVLRFTREGRVLGADTYQGASAASCWSRGQAWAIYGFTWVYRATGVPAFYDAARRTADYWIAHTRADPVPLWDFDRQAGVERPVRDTFAAALASAGFLALADASAPDSRRLWIDAAIRTVGALLQEWFNWDVPGWDGLLRGVALDVPRGHGIGESAIVADSYLVESLWRLRRPGRQHGDGLHETA